MKKLLLILTISSFAAIDLMAQQPVFSVLLNKGQNTYGIKNNYQSVLVGTSLNENDFIQVEERGYVALVHEITGASLELTKSGTFSAKELEDEISQQPNTVLAKYGKYLMKKLNPDEQGNQNLNVTGAVERGEAGLIEVALPKVNDLFGDQVNVSWKQIDDVQDYFVTIKDKLDDVIITQAVSGNRYILDLNNAKLQDEKIIIINITARDKAEIRSPDFGIKRLDLNERKSVGNEFKSLKMVANADNVVDKLLIASFFEENHLILDALTYYNEALAITPDPDGFNILYNNFLARNGLKN